MLSLVGLPLTLFSEAYYNQNYFSGETNRGVFGFCVTDTPITIVPNTRQTGYQLVFKNTCFRPMTIFVDITLTLNNFRELTKHLLLIIEPDVPVSLEGDFLSELERNQYGIRMNADWDIVPVTPSATYRDYWQTTEGRIVSRRVALKEYADPSDFLQEEPVVRMVDSGLEIHKGLNPPYIEGQYYCTEPIGVWDELGGEAIRSIWFAPGSFMFKNQTTEGLIDVFSSQFDEERNLVVSIEESDGMFIRGNENRFTIFLNTVSESTNCTTQEVRIISGELNTEDDSLSFQMGLYITQRLGPCLEIMPENKVRVIDFDLVRVE